MALLSQAERDAVQADFCSQTSANHDLLNVTGPDLTTGVAAVDQWIEDNQASFLAALPQPFRGATTTKQKLDLFTRIAYQRYTKS